MYSCTTPNVRINLYSIIWYCIVLVSTCYNLSGVVLWEYIRNSPKGGENEHHEVWYNLVGLIWQVTWMSTGEKGKEDKSECVYSGSGKVPLICAACAFVGLAIAMVMEHAYMLIAVSKSSPTLLTWDPDSASTKSLTWQAGFFFITTW